MSATNEVPVAVRCSGVTRDFGAGETHVRVLRAIDLTLPPGELTMLVGPSGCGKTTLISIIAGILGATAGDVEVFGRRLSTLRRGALAEFRRTNVGFVFQQFNLLPALTATENAAIPLFAANVERKLALRRAAALLERLGLGAHLNKLPAQLSGGQQQRIAIARALVHEPRLVVCDEPTASLDAASGQAAMELFRQVAVRPDCAAIVVTHDSRIFHFADRVVEMSDGRIVATTASPQSRSLSV